MRPNQSLQRIAIRRAVGSDSSEIANLTAELGYSVTETEISERLAALLPLPNLFIAVAEAQDRLLGWVSAEERLLLETGARIEIIGLVVSAEHRRIGIGRALVAAVEKWQRGRGVRVIFVRSNVARPESHPFYESIGYRRLKTQHAYIKQPAA